MNVGDTVTFLDCYGANPLTGTIESRNYYSSNVRVGDKVYMVPDTLIVKEDK